VLLFGITLKFFIKNPTGETWYDPTKSEVARKLGTMRALLSWSLAGVFGLQMLMRPLHKGLVAYTASLSADGRRAALVGVRAAIVVGMGSLSGVPWPPWQFVILQAACALLQCALLHIELRLEVRTRLVHSSH
jgi:hypothetical protein